MTASMDSIHIYREMLKLDPGSRVSALLAEELCAAGMWEEAAEVCTRGLQAHPDHLRSRVLLGWALMEMGEAKESERILLQVENDFRKNSVIFKMLSEFAAFSGDSRREKELAALYEAFHAPVSFSQTVETRSAEPEAREAVPDEPASKPAKAQSPEVLLASDLEELLAQAAEEPIRQISAAAPMENLLTGLAERIDRRFAETEPAPPLFSEADKDFIRQFTTAALAG